MLLELPDGKQFGRWYHFLGLPDGIVPAEKSAGLFFHWAALLIFKKFLKKMNFIKFAIIGDFRERRTSKKYRLHGVSM